MKIVAVLLPLASLLLGACADSPRRYTSSVTRTFDASGVSRVIIRAADAHQTSEINLPASTPPTVTVSATPIIKINGLSQPDLRWRWLPHSHPVPDFVARRFGSTLIISSKNEVRENNIAHHLCGPHFWIRLPKNVESIRETRALTSDGSADLSPPATKAIGK